MQLTTGLFVAAAIVRGSIRIPGDLGWRLPYMLQWVGGIGPGLDVVADSLGLACSSTDHWSLCP
jgi:hypothetical protein